MSGRKGSASRLRLVGQGDGHIHAEGNRQRGNRIDPQVELAPFYPANVALVLFDQRSKPILI